MISEKFASALTALRDFSLFVFHFSLRLLILSAVDSYNLIYSLACVNMSKIASSEEPSGEYRGRTDDLLHAMQAL